MANWGWSAPEETPVRRVRDDVRDGMAVVACSAAMSTVVSLVVLVLTKFAG